MKTVTLAVTLALLSTTAFASETQDKIVRAFVWAKLYDQNCESIPKAALRTMETIVNTVPLSVAKPTMFKAVARYKELGLANFCVEMKPRIELLVDAF